MMWMDRQMKKIISASFSVSALCLMMSGCGGGSNNISESPAPQPGTSTGVGCSFSGTSSDSCIQYVLEYPVAGIQYQCSSDKVNTFATKLEGNIVTGACKKSDIATFFLNINTTTRIDLGSVKMSDLGEYVSASSPLHLSVLKMAQGLTGQAPQDLTSSDSTTKVALALIKIFQAAGVQKAKANVIGDVQPYTLNTDSLQGLSSITQKVDVTALQNGSYAGLLRPWIDVNAITDDQALQVLKKGINVSLGSLYQADLPIELFKTSGLNGFAGSGNTQKTLLGSFFLSTDRQGMVQGYGIQWRGTPTMSSSSAVSNALVLVTNTDPIMMYSNATQPFLDPIRQTLVTGTNSFKFLTSDGNTLSINQGKLLNDYAFAGTESFYKQNTKKSDVVQSELTTWTQNVGIDQYAGTADFIKAAPISYLDRRSFRSISNVEVGQKYDFPLYATLNFKFSENDDPFKDGVNLGIKIDQNGDISTDVKDWSNNADLSGDCGVSKTKQYSVGTVAASSYIPAQNDYAISPRIILSGTQFGALNGVLLGVDTNALNATGTILANGVRVKINLYNLISNGGEINISASNNGAAQWVNFYNAYKLLYISSRKSADPTFIPSSTDIQTSKRIAGNVSIKLASCYVKNQVKTQS